MNSIHIDYNLTHREIVNLHGYLPESIAHEVIDLAEFADKACDIACDVREGNFHASEDFAKDIINELDTFSKRLRGDNKQDLRAIMFKLEELQGEMARDGEYRREKLNSAIKALEEV